MTLPWMAERIQLRAIASLRPHAGNARVHDAAQLAQIMASMQAFGFTNPLLVDEDGVLIAGHGRLAAAEALGIAKVPVIVLKHLAPAQKEALRLADNRIAENATWDQTLLHDALASVQAAEIDLAALGFSADELAGTGINPALDRFGVRFSRGAADAYNNHNRHVFDAPNFELRQLEPNVAIPFLNETNGTAIWHHAAMGTNLHNLAGGRGDAGERPQPPPDGALWTGGSPPGSSASIAGC